MSRRYSRGSTILHSLALLCLAVSTEEIKTQARYKQVKMFYADLLEDGILNKNHPLFELGFGIKDQLNKYLLSLQAPRGVLANV